VHPGARPGGHRGQHPDQPGRDRLGGAGVEQVRGGGQLAADPGWAAAGGDGLGQDQAQVELGPGGPGRYRLGAQPGQVQHRQVGVLQGQQHLE
jgi:hypothetical protein